MSKSYESIAKELATLIDVCKANRWPLNVYVEGEHAGELQSAKASDGYLVLRYRIGRSAMCECSFGPDELKGLAVTPQGLRGNDDDGEPIRVMATGPSTQRLREALSLHAAATKSAKNP
jgi:hypothetical protein